MPLEFCIKCKSIINERGECSNKNCMGYDFGLQPTDIKIKRRGWHINGTFMDFRTPVTYEEAVEQCSKLTEIARKAFEDDK